MKASTVSLVVVAGVLTVVNFLIQRLVFPPTAVPPPQWLPVFIFLGFWDALAFGVGIALLIYLAINFSKWPTEMRGPVFLMFFIALWFSTLNWVHDGLHESGADLSNWPYLALTELTFHFPWLLFSVGLVLAALRIVRVQAKKQ